MKIHPLPALVAVSFALAGVLAVCSCPPCALAEPFGCTLTPTFDSIEVSWTKAKGAASYRIYRADATKAMETDTKLPARRRYKLVKKNLPAASRSYSDAGGSWGHHYAYAIEARGKDGSLLESTFEKGTMVSACVGFGKPELLNGGYGEFATNSKKRLHLYINLNWDGVQTNRSKVRIYRKEPGSKKYKLIATVKAPEGSAEYTDKKVKAGKTYCYRVCQVQRAKGKMRKSKMSKALKLPAVNFAGTYKANRVSLEPVGTCSAKLVVKLARGKKYDGVTVIKHRSGEYWYSTKASAAVDKDNAKLWRRCTAAFKRYSIDGVQWKKIPSKGVKLPKNKPLYLEALIEPDPEGGAADLAGIEDATNAFIETYDDLMLVYRGCGRGYTSAVLNLRTGKGNAYQDFD